MKHLRLALSALLALGGFALAAPAFALDEKAVPPQCAPLSDTYIRDGTTNCAYLMKVNSDGSINVAVTSGGGGNTTVIGPTADGSAATTAPVLTAGTSDGTGTGVVDVIRADATGNQFFKLVDTGGTNIAAVNANGGQAVAGDVASGATDSGNPVKVGGVYLSTLTTVITGQRKDLQVDSVGLLRVSLCNPNATVSTNCQQVSSTFSDGASNAGPIPSVAARMAVNNGSTEDTARAVNGAGTAGVGVQAANPVPCSISNCGVTGASSSAVASSLVLKASAGNLYYVNVVAGASAGFVMFFNATSAPADGAVTPAYCMPLAANAGFNMANTPLPVFFSTGITVVFSTTGCYIKTASATAFISGAAQ